jgi:methyltransferase (TIGR00027 family)
MEQKSMTALVSAFARWYHTEHNEVRIFDDCVAGKILTDDEKQQISFNMGNGIGFFNPSFKGTSEDALRWIVDNYLSPTPLGRAAWAEKALQTAVSIGASQHMVVAAGYDTFAYRQPSWAKTLSIFEFDHPSMSEDKQKRVQYLSDEKPDNLVFVPIDLTAESLDEKLRSCRTYDKSATSFYSLLGISYYLSKNDFKVLLQNISSSIRNGSAVAFDYPDEYTYTEQAGERAKKQSMLASGTNEEMLASYSHDELCRLLSDCGFLIYEHLNPDEITTQYFNEYNAANPNNRMTAFDNTNYCLAVKKYIAQCDSIIHRGQNKLPSVL